MVTKELRDHVLGLSPRDRYELAVDLWDSITGQPEAWPEVSPELLQELRRRAEAHDRDPSSGLTWEQVKQRIRAKRPT